MKLPFGMRKKDFSVILILIAVIAIFSIINHPAIVGASAVTRQLPIYCVQRDNKAVSLLSPSLLEEIVPFQDTKIKSLYFWCLPLPRPDKIKKRLSSPKISGEYSGLN